MCTVITNLENILDRDKWTGKASCVLNHAQKTSRKAQYIRKQDTIFQDFRLILNRLIIPYALIGVLRTNSIGLWMWLLAMMPPANKSTMALTIFFF